MFFILPRKSTATVQTSSSQSKGTSRKTSPHIIPHNKHWLAGSHNNGRQSAVGVSMIHDNPESEQENTVATTNKQPKAQQAQEQTHPHTSQAEMMVLSVSPSLRDTSSHCQPDPQHIPAQNTPSNSSQMISQEILQSRRELK